MLARAACAAAAVIGAAWLIAPRSGGWSAYGETLDLGQRDVRVHDELAAAYPGEGDAPHPSFPGAAGGALAIWKAAVEWGSELHGDGQGDPHQPGGLGSGGANFDPSWQGLANAPGGATDNVHALVDGDGGGVLAYCETSTGGGWRIRYYRDVAWDDGPEPPPLGRIDLQGAATHEYGHALGLGHSTTVGATMYASSNGTGIYQRSLAPDDVAGVQAIYGAKSPSKPRITSAAIAGGVVTLRGERFAPAGNQVWFTRADRSHPSADPIVRVNAVASADGGTRIEVALPAKAGPGDVLVRVPGDGHAALSNAWPFDPSAPAQELPAPTVTSVAPAILPAVAPEPRVVALGGAGFSTLTEVRVGGAPVAPELYAVLSDDALLVTLPDQGGIGPLAIEVANAFGASAPVAVEIVAPDPPALALKSASLYSSTGIALRIGAQPGTVWMLAGSTMLGPSVLPGVLHADIGAGFQMLVLITSGLVDAGGVAELVVPVHGLPYGTPVYLQAATLGPPAPVLPCGMTGVAAGTFLY